MSIGIKGEYDLQVGKKTYLLKFGTNSTAIFCDERKMSLAEMQQRFQDLKVGELRDFIWAAAVAGCHARQQAVDFDPLDVGDWIDDLPNGELERIMDIIAQSSEADTKNSTGPKPTAQTEIPAD